MAPYSLLPLLTLAALSAANPISNAATNALTLLPRQDFSVVRPAGEAAKLKKLTEFPDFYDSEYYSYTLSEVDPDPRRKVDLFELGLIAANCQLQLMVKLNSYPPGTRGPGTPLEDTDFSCSAVDASEKIVTITRAPGATDPLQFIRMSVVLRDMLHVFSALNEQQSEYNDGVMDVYEKTVDEHARPTRLLMKVSVVTFDGKFNAPPPRQIA